MDRTFELLLIGVQAYRCRIQSLFIPCTAAAADKKAKQGKGKSKGRTVQINTVRSFLKLCALTIDRAVKWSTVDRGNVWPIQRETIPRKVMVNEQ